jgi:hypothetical protein
MRGKIKKRETQILSLTRTIFSNADGEYQHGTVVPDSNRLISEVSFSFDVCIALGSAQVVPVYCVPSTS